MRGTVRGTVLVATAALLAGCSGGAGQTPTESAPATQEEPREYVLDVTVPAPSLEGNLLGDPAERQAEIVLPPSYYDVDERYPVVYFLNGLDESRNRFAAYQGVLADQMLQPGKREFILVSIDGNNALGGNFYANSPVGGNMEDFVAQDLVDFVDATYRTVAEPGARGLTGFSMGGFGTINVGLHRPDVFGSIYALSPGLLVPDGGLEDMLADNGPWPEYAATFAPDPDATQRPYAHLLDSRAPLDGQDPAVVAGYQSGFGDLREKVEAYLAAGGGLSHIKLDYGTSDSYSWIPAGGAYLDGLLTELGVPHTTQTFAGGHQVQSDYYTARLVDYFSEQLAG